MTKDFIDDLFEVVEVKKTVKKSSKESFRAKKANSFEIAGLEVKQKRIVSEETKRNISESLKGRVHSEETKKNIREAVKKSMTEEVRRKMSESAKGKIISEETRRKLSEAHKGRKHPPVTEEARKKMSEFQRNRVRKPMSEETKKKLSEAHKGKNKPPLSEETKRKMSEVRRGKKRTTPITEEHIRKLVASRNASLPSVMTPYGEFVTRKALIQKITSDGVLNATDKLREWLKLYPNDYYVIKKPKKNRRIQGVAQAIKSKTST